LLTAGRRIAYFTDTAGLTPAVKALIRGVDCLICDATFHGPNWYPHSHMNIDEAVALGREAGARRLLLTHLAMHYSEPVTTEDLRAELAARGPGVELAADGMELPL
jgi:phosphoribosyl 1,2-cyclic phosphate phosphodiesterase